VASAKLQFHLRRAWQSVQAPLQPSEPERKAVRAFVTSTQPATCYCKGDERREMV